MYEQYQRECLQRFAAATYIASSVAGVSDCSRNHFNIPIHYQDREGNCGEEADCSCQGKDELNSEHD